MTLSPTTLIAIGAAGRRCAEVAGVLAFTLGLAGCAVYDWAFGDPTPPPPCPRISVLAEASRITKFQAGAGRDLIDVLYEGEITDVLAACVYDIDKETRDGSLTVELALTVDAARGPADRNREGIFEYFVAIPRFFPHPKGRAVFATRVEFAGNRTRLVVIDEPVSLEIPLKAGQTGDDFDIFVGFVLSPEEVEYNRRRGARP